MHKNCISIIIKKILLFAFIINSNLYTGMIPQTPQDLELASNLIQLMNQTIELDTNVRMNNQLEQKESLMQSIKLLHNQNASKYQKFNIKKLQTTALEENKLREIFTMLLDTYISIFGQMYQKTSTIFYGYSKYLILASQSDKNQAITPVLYPQLLETIKLAEQQSDWAMNVRIDLPVILESNIAIMQPCTLTTIIKALEQMPPTSAYYTTAKNIALGAAAVGATAAIAYGVYTYGDQLKSLIPSTANTAPSSDQSTSQITIENNEKSNKLSAIDVLAAGENKKLNNPVLTSILAHKKENSSSEQKTTQPLLDTADIHPTAQNYVAKQTELQNNPPQKTGIFENEPKIVLHPTSSNQQSSLNETLKSKAAAGDTEAKIALTNIRYNKPHNPTTQDYIQKIQLNQTPKQDLQETLQTAADSGNLQAKMIIFNQENGLHNSPNEDAYLDNILKNLNSLT